MTNKPLLKRLVTVLAAVWLCGMTVFYLVRFSAVFYRANAPAVDKAIGQVMGRLAGP